MKTKYFEIDKFMFNKIKNSSYSEGIVDNYKYFENLDKNDKVIFSYNEEKIEAKLIEIIIYNSITKVIYDFNLPHFSLICEDPTKIFSLINSLELGNKKIRLFKIRYKHL